MKNKYLYKFTVPKVEEVEVVETRKEGDQEVKITKKEKKVVEKSYGIASPKRSLLEEGEMFYAAKVSENIKSGILPTSILIRKFDADGGFLSDSELKYQNSLSDRSTELNRKLINLSAEVDVLKVDLEKNPSEEKAKLKQEKENEMNDLLDEFYEVQEEILKIKQSVDAFFEQSAEIKARNKTIIWWVLNLSYALEEGKEDQFFRGKSFEDKLKSLDDLEESEEEFVGYLIKKFSYLISYWYSARITKEEQFKEAEKNFRLITGVKEYEVKVDEIKKKSEEKTQEKTQEKPQEKAAEAPPSKEVALVPEVKPVE